MYFFKAFVNILFKDWFLKTNTCEDFFCRALTNKKYYLKKSNLFAVAAFVMTLYVDCGLYAQDRMMREDIKMVVRATMYPKTLYIMP